MPLQNIPLSKDDFDKFDWQKIVEVSDKKECHNYSTAYFKKANEFEKNNDLTGQEIFTLLGAITSMMLKPESFSEPFGPVAVFQGSRSAIVEDFNDNHLEVLNETINDIHDPELKARIADVLWIRKKDYKVAQIAVDSYLESAIRLGSPEHWTQPAERIERALRLSVSLGKKSPLFSKVIEHIESVLKKYGGDDPLFFSQNLMGLLLEFNQGNPITYSQLSEKIALKAESKSNHYKARSLWETRAKWLKMANDNDGEVKALVKAAETYVKEAEQAAAGEKPSHLVASSHLQSAIEAYRRIGGHSDRIEKLHNILLDYQEKSLAEMGVIKSDGIDLTEAIQDSINRVKGKPFYDAIFDFVLMVPSPKVSELRKQVEESAAKHPMQHLVSGVIVNENGKVVARHSNMYSDDPEERERAIQENMFRQASFHHQIYTHSLIEPVRVQLNQEHPIQLDNFMRIVSNNPFVPKGREYIFARGLKAGMEGDYLTAVHLLIPQIENSARHILTQVGEVTSGIDSKGIQDERSLNTTLYSDSILKVFGEDIVFDLKGLLVERFGANVRNRMAHGLMDHNSFYSVEIPYLWCLVLKLCCLPIIQHIRNSNKQQHGETGEPSGETEKEQ
jgi:hypothetical protein